MQSEGVILLLKGVITVLEGVFRNDITTLLKGIHTESKRIITQLKVVIMPY